jgi:SAM-dependent methyltransferase
VAFTEADAAAPPLAPAAYDVVLSRHVLWAMPDPADALARWHALLRPGGTVLLVEGRWGTGAGLTGAQSLALARAHDHGAVLHPLPDPALWGREVEDERYLVVCGPAAPLP